MVKHPLCHFFLQNYYSSYISSCFLFFFFFFFNSKPFVAVLVSHPSSPVQSAWVPVLFQSGYTRGCRSSLQMTDRWWLVAVFIAIMSELLPSLGKQKGQSCPPNTDLRSLPSSADLSLCFLEGCNDRSVPEGNSSPSTEKWGSGEDVV